MFMYLYIGTVFIICIDDMKAHEFESIMISDLFFYVFTYMYVVVGLNQEQYCTLLTQI